MQLNRFLSPERPSPRKAISYLYISWPCVNGKIYEVHKSTDLLAPWPGSPITNNMPADVSGTNRLRDVNALNNGAAFYHVEVHQ